MICAVVLVLVAGNVLSGSSKKNPAIQALKEEIKQLRAEEKLLVKDIEARFKALITLLEDPELKLEQLRAELRKEEHLVLKLIKDAKQKKQVKAWFDALIKKLTADIKARKEVIKEVKAERKAVIQEVKALYTAKIKELEAEIQALETGKPVKRK
jgi:DNA repair exonuclease SbcCD ATPase subunit